MQLTHLTPRDYAVSTWSGGTTTQIAIAPQGALYADRAFLWRVSSATVELERSDFTPLPAYHRLISVLEGEMHLCHDGGEELTLAPYQVHAFDGAAATRSRGRCTDFNLMLQKGRCKGSLEAVLLRGETQEFPARPAETLLVFCGRGRGTVGAGGRQLALLPGESALLEQTDAATLEGDGAFFLARMERE